MRTPLQDRSTSSADRMLEATLDLLETGGLPAVTVAAVAVRAGTSNGSLYHRFGDVFLQRVTSVYLPEFSVRVSVFVWF